MVIRNPLAEAMRRIAEVPLPELRRHVQDEIVHRVDICVTCTEAIRSTPSVHKDGSVHWASGGWEHTATEQSSCGKRYPYKAAQPGGTKPRVHTEMQTAEVLDGVGGTHFEHRWHCFTCGTYGDSHVDGVVVNAALKVHLSTQHGCTSCAHAPHTTSCTALACTCTGVAQ